MHRERTGARMQYHTEQKGMRTSEPTRTYRNVALSTAMEEGLGKVVGLVTSGLFG